MVKGSSKLFWKNSFSKKLALEYYLPYITRRDGISFFQKNDLVVYVKKGKMIFSKKSKKA